LPLLGEKDLAYKIYVRMVPANPFHCCDRRISALLAISEKYIYQCAMRITDDQDFDELICPLRINTNCYPLINRTCLYFVLLPRLPVTFSQHSFVLRYSNVLHSRGKLHAKLLIEILNAIYSARRATFNRLLPASTLFRF
uniref:FERM domain-containing protein n=1 Tax=Gongylonema pulchrum TaxID=637853 RepID=A0A183EV87_9BILA